MVVALRAGYVPGMLTHDTLDDTLHTLGAVLDHRGAPAVLVGGGGPVLLGRIAVSNRDLDMVAQIGTGALTEAKPPPPSDGPSTRSATRPASSQQPAANTANLFFQ